jgi:hypothetical protein
MSTLNVILKLETNLMYLFAIKSFNMVFYGIMIVVSNFLKNYKVLDLFMKLL